MRHNVLHRGPLESARLHGIPLERSLPRRTRLDATRSRPTRSRPAPSSRERKLAAAGLSAAALLAIAGPASATVPRTVIAELFGAPLCADCPQSRSAMESLETEFDEEQFVWIEYHTSSELANEDSRDRYAYYGSPAIPEIRFDGREHTGSAQTPMGDYRGVVETRLAAGAELSIFADYFFEEEPWLGTVDVEVAFGETIESPEECVIRFVIFEEMVRYCCGTDLEENWRRVVRMMMPDEPLLVGQSGETRTVEYTIPVDPVWNPDRLRAVAFVQRETDRSILNSTVALDAGSLNPVPPDGVDLLELVLDQNFPNPFRETTEIAFRVSKPVWVTIRVVNAHGQVVRVLNDGMREAGGHRVPWNGRDFTGERMANGVYVYELFTSEGSRSKRLVLLR